jgi:hypothetical protein
MLQRQVRVASKKAFVQALLARKIVAIRSPHAEWVDRPLLAAASGAGFIEREGTPRSRLFVHRKRSRRHHAA